MIVAYFLIVKTVNWPSFSNHAGLLQLFLFRSEQDTDLCCISKQQGWTRLLPPKVEQPSGEYDSSC